MDKDIQKQLHNTLVEILDFVAKVCEENNLIYMLVYGTALGAYRHQGFIPWDDDLDIAMPRGDYMKFIAIMEEQNNPLYSIQYEKNEENYYLTFAKVRKNNTVYIEEISELPYKNNGIYIDVFPLENIKNADFYTCRIKKHILII